MVSKYKRFQFQLLVLCLFLGGCGIFHARIASAQGPAGSLSTDFDPGAGPDGPVRAIVSLANGKIIIGGTFFSVGGASRRGVAALSANGVLDAEFDPGNGADGDVNALLDLGDGGLLVGGDFSTFNGASHSGLVRLDREGVVDDLYNPDLTNGAAQTGQANFITSLQAAGDRQFLLTGTFARVDDALSNGVARVDTAGELDIAYQPNLGPNGKVNAAVILPTGQIVIAGEFTTVDAIPRPGLARLNSDGQLDTSYNPGTGVAGGTVLAMKLLEDGTLLLGGDFTTVGGQPHAALARVKADGTTDSSFTADANGQVRTLAAQADGRILLGGAFDRVDNIPRGRVARLNPDGTLDDSFDPGTGADAPVNTIVLLPDATALLGGEFTAFNGAARQRVAKISVNLTPVLPTVSITSDVRLIGRGTTNTATITIGRTGSLANKLKVHYTVGGNAVRGVDYAALSGVKKLKAGAAEASFKVTWLDNGQGDGRVSAKIKIAPPAGYAIAGSSKVKIKIDR